MLKETILNLNNLRLGFLVKGTCYNSKKSCTDARWGKPYKKIQFFSDHLQILRLDRKMLFRGAVAEKTVVLVTYIISVYLSVRLSVCLPLFCYLYTVHPSNYLNLFGSIC